MMIITKNVYTDNHHFSPFSVRLALNTNTPKQICWRNGSDGVACPQIMLLVCMYVRQQVQYSNNMVHLHVEHKSQYHDWNISQITHTRRSNFRWHFIGSEPLSRQVLWLDNVSDGLKHVKCFLQSVGYLWMRVCMCTHNAEWVH